MKVSSLLKFFKEGFSFGNKHFVYLLPPLILTFIFINTKPTLFTFLAYGLSVGYSLSLPYFFENRVLKHGKYLTILKVSILSLLRIILPLILFILVFGFIIILYFAIVKQSMALFPEQMMQLSTNILFHSLLDVLAAFLVFTSIFFSIENDDFIKSTWKSIELSIKNYKFLLILVILDVTFNNMFRVIQQAPNFGVTLASLLANYYWFIKLAFTYLYYKSLPMVRFSSKL